MKLLRRRPLAVLLPTLAVAVLVVASLLALDGEDRDPPGPGGSSGSGPGGDAALAAFDSCGALLDRLAENPVTLARPEALPLPTAARASAAPVMQAAARDSSFGAGAALGGPVGSSATGTNVQEAGIDEPDLVKSDGETIFALRGRRLFAVSAGPDPRVLGALELPGAKLGAEASELLLYEDRVLILTSRQRLRPDPRIQTVLIAVDVSDPSTPRVERRAILDGRYLSARLSGSTVRLALSSRPSYPIAVDRSEGGGSAAVEARIDPGAAAASEDWLPQAIVRSDGVRAEGELLGCEDVRAPKRPAGAGMLSVSTIDLDAGLDVVDSDAVLADGETVYASAESIYVATISDQVPSQGFVDAGVRALTGGAVSIAPPPRVETRTEIHRFDTAESGETNYVASGTVDGLLLNQYSMSERDGVLRVATTTGDSFGDAGGTESQGVVITLEQDGDRLVELGRLDGLGSDERIQAVRFIDELGFVVTFRQVDPLHVIDLSDPGRPRELGELKIPGYSAYLHPVGDERLLGVGQDADRQGGTQGTQVSLFDVSDLTDPERIDELRAGRFTSSPVEYDARAFTYLPDERLAVVPIEVFRAPLRGAPQPEKLGAIAYEVGPDGTLSERARLDDPGGPGRIRRSLAIDGMLYTVSDRGVVARDLDAPDLAITGSASFDEAG